MEIKIIEYEMILLHKYQVRQTEVISRLLFTFLLTRNFGQIEHLHFPNKFSYLRYYDNTFSQLRYHEFRKYSSNHIWKV